MAGGGKASQCFETRRGPKQGQQSNTAYRVSASGFVLLGWGINLNPSATLSYVFLFLPLNDRILNTMVATGSAMGSYIAVVSDAKVPTTSSCFHDGGKEHFVIKRYCCMECR